MYQRILLALDATATRQHSLDTVVALAQKFGSSVHVLHIDASTAAWTTVMPLEDEADAQQLLDSAVKTLVDAGVQAQGELLDKFIAEVPATITDTAERTGANLIVLSPHHRGVVETWFNPRVSDNVSHAAHVPVLLIPDAPRA